VQGIEILDDRLGFDRELGEPNLLVYADLYSTQHGYESNLLVLVGPDRKRSKSVKYTGSEFPDSIGKSYYTARSCISSPSFRFLGSRHFVACSQSVSYWHRSLMALSPSIRLSKVLLRA
jgi:hypothetical protein